jgi:hypothetical protein
LALQVTIGRHSKESPVKVFHTSIGELLLEHERSLIDRRLIVTTADDDMMILGLTDDRFEIGDLP